MTKEEFRKFCTKTFKKYGFKKINSYYHLYGEKGVTCGIYLQRGYTEYYYINACYNIAPLESGTHLHPGDMDMRSCSRLPVDSKSVGVNGKFYKSAQIEYERWDEEELLPYFEDWLENVVIPPVIEGKQYMLDNYKSETIDFSSPVRDNYKILQESIQRDLDGIGFEEKWVMFQEDDGSQKLIDEYLDKLYDKVFYKASASKLDESCNSSKTEYAIKFLHDMHKIFIEVYGTSCVDKEYQSIYVPSVFKGTESGYLAVGLACLDLESCAEYCGAIIFTSLGRLEIGTDKVHTTEQEKYFNDKLVPLDYWYTPEIPNDIHVDMSDVPSDVKELLNFDNLINKEYKKMQEALRSESEQKRILQNLSLMPNIVIPFEITKWIHCYKKDLNKLVKSGSLSKEENGYLMNPKIKEEILLSKDEFIDNLRTDFLSGIFWGGYFRESETTMDAKLSIAESFISHLKIRKDLTYGLIYHNVAFAYYKQGMYDLALTHLKNVQKICENIYGFNHIESSRVYNDFGEIYNKQAKYDLALKYYEKAMKIREEKLSADDIALASVYHDMAFAYVGKAENDLAIEYSMKFLEIVLKVFEYDNPKIEIYIIDFCENFQKIYKQNDILNWINDKLTEKEFEKFKKCREYITSKKS